jgi:hypothetical protein
MSTSVWARAPLLRLLTNLLTKLLPCTVPNLEDIVRLLHVAEQRGFPGMLKSLDCMHWEWERCPIALHGHYRGHFKKPTIILEVVASADL